MAEVRIGIDVGGTGIKGALVDTSTGLLTSERVRIPTPQPSLPDKVVKAVKKIVNELELEGPVGVGFPAVVVDGLVSTANNIDQSWIGVNVRDLLSDALGRRVVVVNDADAAAMAEVTFGAARGLGGKILVLTFGTGIGSGLIVDGRLIPNLELGVAEYEGVRPAELRFSARGREEEGISWRKWGDEISGYIEYVSTVVNPDIVVLGGGAAKEWDRFAHRIPEHLGVVCAQLLNNAGIVGGALLVAD
ncbi:MAG TPA: ROK family protein [Acidimicrobiia bacterium]